jgi:transposase
MAHDFKAFVGIDWAREHHDVCVLDALGKLVAERRFKHDGEELKKLCEWLRAQGQAAQVAIGIETPHGPVVETLLERGFAVFSLNPKQLDRFRDRFSLAGCKDDRLDARVLAESVRTDQARFRPLQLPPPRVLELRECSRLRDELQHERQRWLNRLRDQLWRYFPALLQLTENIDTDWFLELCTLVPTPDKAQRVAPEQVEALLKTHRVRSLDAATVLQRLRAQALRVPAPIVAAAQEHVGIFVAQLRLLTQQHRRALRRLDELTAQLAQEQEQQKQRDVEILDSLPGVGRIVLAALIAEAYEPLQERNYHALRALSGAAPVTRRSGKSLHVQMRRACSPLLRDALYHWSRSAMQRDPRCRQRYRSLRGRGKTHGHALRELGDHLLLVTCAMLRTGQLYDPAHRSPRQSAPDEGRT